MVSQDEEGSERYWAAHLLCNVRMGQRRRMDLVSPKNTAETCVALCVRHPNGHLAGRGHAVANSWRTGADICSYWSTDNTVNPYCHGVADIIQNNEQYSRYSAPFGWNDPCFLVTGKTPYLFFLQMAETRRTQPRGDWHWNDVKHTKPAPGGYANRGKAAAALPSGRVFRLTGLPA